MDELENPEPSNKSFFGGFASMALLVWDFLKIVLIALIIIVPIRYFVFQPFIVSGSSMVPNFENGQYLIIDEISYHFGSPHRGDVIVLKYPKNPKEFFIKRLIGLPGDKVEVDNGHVKINGTVLTESYLPNQSLSYPHDTTIIGGTKALTLGPDEYFMMGDNRLASSDSRDWGILKRSGMIGKVFIRALPLTDFQVYTNSPAYSF